MNDLAFLAAARSLVGTPWRDRGRSPAGIDCLGIVALGARACGLEAVFEALHGASRDYRALVPVLCRFASRIGEARPGALLIYRRAELGIRHVAISTDQGTVIHIAGPGHVVTEAPLNFAPSQIWGIAWPS